VIQKEVHGRGKESVDAIVFHPPGEKRDEHSPWNQGVDEFRKRDLSFLSEPELRVEAPWHDASTLRRYEGQSARLAPVTGAVIISWGTASAASPVPRGRQHEIGLQVPTDLQLEGERVEAGESGHPRFANTAFVKDKTFGSSSTMTTRYVWFIELSPEKNSSDSTLGSDSDSERMGAKASYPQCGVHCAHVRDTLS